MPVTTRKSKSGAVSLGCVSKPYGRPMLRDGFIKPLRYRGIVLNSLGPVFVDIQKNLKLSEKASNVGVS